MTNPVMNDSTNRLAGLEADVLVKRLKRMAQDDPVNFCYLLARIMPMLPSNNSDDDNRTPDMFDMKSSRR